MILGFLAVTAVTDLFSVQFTECNCGNNSQWNSLVCRSKQHIKVVAKVIVDGLSVILAQLLELIARHVSTCIHKKWRFSSTLQCKIAKFENITLYHKLNELTLVTFHCILSSCIKRHSALVISQFSIKF